MALIGCTSYKFFTLSLIMERSVLKKCAAQFEFRFSVIQLCRTFQVFYAF